MSAAGGRARSGSDARRHRSASCPPRGTAQPTGAAHREANRQAARRADDALRQHTLLSWGDTGARGQTSRADGEPDQQRTETEQRQPRQKGSTDTQTGVRDPTDTEEQQRQDRRPRAATSQGSLTGRADQTGSTAPTGLAGRLHQQQPQRNPAQRTSVDSSP